MHGWRVAAVLYLCFLWDRVPSVSTKARVQRAAGDAHSRDVPWVVAEEINALNQATLISNDSKQDFFSKFKYHENKSQQYFRLFVLKRRRYTSFLGIVRCRGDYCVMFAAEAGRSESPLSLAYV